MPSGRYVTYQLKRYRAVKASDISDAVKEFRDGRWAKRSERFVSPRRRTLTARNSRKKLRRRPTRSPHSILPSRSRSGTWNLCTSHRLRRHPDIVLEFFGPVWSRRFFGQPEVLGTSGTEIASAVKAALVESAAISLVSNDWAPPRLRPRLDELSKSDPELYRQLAEQFGSPPEPPLVAAATLAPPPWLQTATDGTWSLVRASRRRRGEWSAASRAWERVASMRTGAAAAGPLTQAAIAANTGGDRAKYDELLEAAAAADEHNVRLILERLDEFTPPAEQLRLLDGLRSRDPEELGLIAARRALAHLLVPDTAAARAALDEVRKHLAPSLLVDELEVSIAVQEGRLAVLDHRTLDRGALLGAASKAAAVRDRLLEERRFSESTRMLMLIADTHALLGDRLKASKVLRTATPDERETSGEQKEVLAQSAAGRALDAGLTLPFIEGAEETPTVLQVRLESLETTGTPAERQAALDGLDAFVRAGGASAPEAAFNRLRRPSGPSDAME